MSPVHRITVVVAAIALLTACGTVAPPPEDSYWRLQPPLPQPVAATPVLAGVLEVQEVEVDGVLGDRALAYTADGTRLRQYAYDFWVEAPARAVRDALIAHLRAAGIARDVVPPEVRADADWILRTRLRRFDHVVREPGSGSGKAADGPAQVVVEMEFILSPAGGGPVRLLRAFQAVETTPDTAVRSAVEALDRATARVFLTFSRRLADAGRIN